MKNGLKVRLNNAENEYLNISDLRNQQEKRILMTYFSLLLFVHYENL